MIGLLFEVFLSFFLSALNDTNIDIARKNGPIHVQNDYSAFENEYAWTSVADYVWIDQPV
jgi:hypothetical protein